MLAVGVGGEPAAQAGVVLAVIKGGKAYLGVELLPLVGEGAAIAAVQLAAG